LQKQLDLLDPKKRQKEIDALAKREMEKLKADEKALKASAKAKEEEEKNKNKAK